MNILPRKGKSIFENHLLDNALGTINSVEFNSITKEQNRKNKIQKNNSPKNNINNNNFTNKYLTETDKGNFKKTIDIKFDSNLKVYFNENDADSIKRNKSMRLDLVKNRKKYKLHNEDILINNNANFLNENDKINESRLYTDDKKSYETNNFYFDTKDTIKSYFNDDKIYQKTIFNDYKSNDFHNTRNKDYNTTIYKDEIDESSYKNFELDNLLNNFDEKIYYLSNLNNKYEDSNQNIQNEIIDYQFFNNKNFNLKNSLLKFNCINVNDSQKYLRAIKQQNFIDKFNNPKIKRKNLSKMYKNYDLINIKNYFLSNKDTEFTKQIKNENILTNDSKESRNNNFIKIDQNEINNLKTINTNVILNTTTNHISSVIPMEDFGTQFNFEEDLRLFDNKKKMKDLVNNKKNRINKDINPLTNCYVNTTEKIFSKKNLMRKLDETFEREFIRRDDRIDKFSNFILNQNIKVKINNFNSSNFINFDNFYNTNNLHNSFNKENPEIERVKEKYFLSPLNKRREYKSKISSFNRYNIIDAEKRKFEISPPKKPIKKSDYEQSDKKRFVNKIEM